MTGGERQQEVPDSSLIRNYYVKIEFSCVTVYLLGKFMNKNKNDYRAQLSSMIKVKSHPRCIFTD